MTAIKDKGIYHISRETLRREGIPVEVRGMDGLKEGFYRDIVSDDVFYLSYKNGKWYYQYSSHKNPILLTKNDPIICAEKADPKQAIAELKQKQRFIESKLKKLTNPQN